jgi:hypothetical protein
MELSLQQRCRVFLISGLSVISFISIFDLQSDPPRVDFVSIDDPNYWESISKRQYIYFWA